MKKIILIALISVIVIVIGLFFIIGGIEMKEPKIVEIKESMEAIGLMTRTTAKTVFKDLPKLYAEYMAIKDSSGIKNLKSPWEYISLSKNFEGGNTWDYYTGYVVTSYEGSSEKLVKFSMPAGMYAVFPLRCKYKIFFGFKMGRMKQYIYKKWLPTSEYEFAGYEYEYNNEAMHKINPYYVDLYVGIRKK
jgi:predicted transcriptional regulator YdeE